MGSIKNQQPVLGLTALERIGPKGYLRYVFPFQLQDDYDLDEVAGALKAGYEALTTDPGGGVFQTLDTRDATHILVKDLRDSYVSNYADLKHQYFPVAAFDADTFCRRSVWPSTGERMPVSLVQANFIRGGLVLTWCILHMAGDGNSFSTWTAIWAEESRRAQGLEIVAPIQLPDAVWKDREQVTKPSGRNAGELEHHPEYTLLPFTPSGAPPKMTSLNHRGQVFYFSPDSLAALKVEASPGNATEPSDQKWISTNDALSALLWRTVMAVQSPLDTLEGDPVSVFNYVAVILPIRKMLSTLSLADLAIQIRKAILRADKQFTDDVVALVDRLEDVDRLVPTAFLDVPGYNCVQTSWLNFKLYGLDWGSLLGHRIEAVRVPHIGCINGAQVVLPVLPDGGMEILVGVEESCLDRLLTDPLFTKYGVAR
ncbi:hypothetical protein ASPACDRAFT_53627 [Aspergillus aculeatus ATCC 16872]|uniref:Trichothecene 3-O-acetyltransferase-like N-terminal domain-containing protein n=1 Tax=Aspergillus aculeatus (strain ATCC 16872 / CBS 172.66 / WB 5094) TaxID=690307 RepID=A0A1L9WMJ1_ASPA1|nr:uncharacterized protein ASPACDRAFT_53627 [Aspergillus aculeatus ATCC 16872]OJJ97389.1 hypothetical protein ASPACDRAFT_53627 [Aspergillus aculeatus ATCC 16872]